MVTIREYQDHDAAEVGLLIKETYSQFNLDYMPARDQAPFLGPFQHLQTTRPRSS